MSDEIPKSPPLPAALYGVAQRVRSAGHEAWLVGEPLQSLLCKETPPSFEIATSASPARLLELFPTAVPTHASWGIVTIPTPAGPVDAVGFRNGPEVTDDLAHRDFTLNAMAYDPVADRLLDPFSGHRDLSQDVLRCVGSAEARLAEDPLRALRAARLVGGRALRVDPELERAMPKAVPLLDKVEAGRLRRELSRLLLAPRAAAALALLRRTGLENALIHGVQDDAGALVESLPQSLPLRLAGWLRGTRAAPLLHRLRLGLTPSKRVLQLLEHHPLDADANPARDPSVRRLLRGLPEDDLAALFHMREWELARQGAAVESGAATNGEPGNAAAVAEITAARAKLDALRRAIDRVRSNDERRHRRMDLALDGRAVMQVLGCGPGPQVGSALAYLAERVASDPSCNTPQALRELLEEWPQCHFSDPG